MCTNSGPVDGAIITTSQERRDDRFVEGPLQLELVVGGPNDERVSDRTELVR